jgi:hypothetical protein
MLANSSTSCDIYLGISPEFGVGVYAGRTWEPNELVDSPLQFHIPKESIFGNELMNYAEGRNDTHVFLSLGYGSLFNHAYSPNIRKDIRGRELDENTAAAVGANYDVYFSPKSVLMPGQQMFIFYSEEWFYDRGLVAAEPKLPLSKEISVVPGCPRELINVIEGRNTAAEFIEQGQIIEISRALLLQGKEELLPHRLGSLGKLLWWRQEELNTSPNFVHNATVDSQRRRQQGNPHNITYYENEAYALLLMGYGTLYQPASSPTEVNVVYNWWWPDSDTVRNCTTRMFVSFTAARDIHPGEVLVVDIRVDEETHMKYTLLPRFADKCL